MKVENPTVQIKNTWNKSWQLEKKKQPKTVRETPRKILRTSKYLVDSVGPLFSHIVQCKRKRIKTKYEGQPEEKDEESQCYKLIHLQLSPPKGFCTTFQEAFFSLTKILCMNQKKLFI